MKKFQSKTGLPEALGSTAHIPHTVPLAAPRKVSKEMCYISGCKSIRTDRDETMPDGTKERVYTQGKGDIVIRTKDGTVQGYVCYYHYQKILDEAGKDQLSCVRNEGINAPQEDIGFKPNTPQNLVEHLRVLEDQLADQWASSHDD